MSHQDLLEKINDHKKNISSSFLFYRTVAKTQKIIVLNAATKFLSGKMSKEDFIKIKNENPKYSDAFGASRTKDLIEIVLNEKPANNRTKEGYIRDRLIKYIF